MLRFGILTVSDRSARGERPDLSGPAIRQALETQGWNVLQQTVCSDEFSEITEILAAWADSGMLDFILTSGGTGLSPRDITPEATLAVVDRPAPGLAEAMRSASLQITPHAMLSRAAAGIRKQTLIINLPGSPRAASENLQTIFPVFEHAAQLLHEDPGAEAGHQTHRRQEE